MPANHATQNKALKHKKKRDPARLKARETTCLSERSSDRTILRTAAGRPLGPAFITEEWDFGDAAIPELVSVVVTRWGPGQVLLGAVVLVDRTCLGVKNAMLLPRQTEHEMEATVARLGEMIGPLRRVEPLVARSVVYHAVAYARSLGFEPHPDFPEAIFGPQPAELLATPLARPARPLYITGPDDDVPAVALQLAEAVGPDGFDVFPGGAPIDFFDEVDNQEIVGDASGGEGGRDEDEAQDESDRVLGQSGS